ncbi:MAG: ribonuclease J [Chloroflexi bacterium]|nr:ribonuclease J [Chloroflexota bacterium]
MKRGLRLTPLGGVGEVGKNCLLLETGDGLILIDAGVQFPDKELLGIDLIIPDISYVADRRDRLRGIIITHGHEDHLGALPYLLNALGSRSRIPVYGSRLVLGLARARLEEHKAEHLCQLTELDFGAVLPLGGITVELFPVGHSIPDAAGLILQSAYGTIVHTSDFKLGEMPAAGLQRLTSLARSGVRLLLSDTVRIESPEPTPSESAVTETIRAIFAEAPGRIIFTTFASNLARVGSVINVAQEQGRFVAIAGRSMERNLAIAREGGYLSVPDELLVPLDRAARLPNRRVVIIMTGSQGEPSSALGRMAFGEHRILHIREGDTVILSATPIPGNQRTVSAIIDNLFRAGARVFYPPVTPNLHSSGHASRQEIGQLLELLKPQYAIPMHGEFRMMKLFQLLAQEKGLPPDHVILPEIGRSLEIDHNGIRSGGLIESGTILVDGLTVGEVNGVVLRDRRALASEGILVVAATLSRTSGTIIRPPQIFARGVPSMEDGPFLTEAEARVSRVLRNAAEIEPENRIVSEAVKSVLAEFIYQRTRLRPMILPVISEL